MQKLVLKNVCYYLFLAVFRFILTTTPAKIKDSSSSRASVTANEATASESTPQAMDWVNAGGTSGSLSGACFLTVIFITIHA